MRAYVLVVAEVSLTSCPGTGARDEILQVPGVVLADVITGPYDLLVGVAADSLEQLRIVFDGIRVIEGVKRSVPCVVLSG